MLNLANTSLLGSLPPPALALVQAAAGERNFPAGAEVFKEGDAGDGLYIVQEGRVEISGAIGPGQRHVFAQAGPGDLFGEMAIIEDKPRSASAVAKGATTVVFIPRETMLAAMRQSPELAISMLREISHRLREFNRQYLTEVLQTERLAIVGRFARAIIHDLKNPLNVISLTAEVAGMPTTSPEKRLQAPARICRQVERITDLINEILDFTQGAPAAFELGAAQYAPYVEQVVSDLAGEIEVKGVKLVLQAPPPPAVVVLLNPKRLRRVFQNIVHNATDVLPDGGSIYVRTELREDGVITEIEDSGPGISPEIAGRLFEAFATHGKAHGTGLGLSICKKIIEDHGGQIWSRTEAGHGAIFAFKLPVIRPA